MPSNRRPLAVALRSDPLLFAPVPPPARIPAVRAEARLAEIADLLAQVPRVDAINVPELVEENHDGRPRYRAGDPRGFAREVAGRTGAEAIINKVVAHVPDPESLRAWARETVGLGIRHAVLVGGSSRFIPYPGPPVTEANALVRAVFTEAGGLLGNIAIPQRRGEAHRMVSKTKAGAGFFTTQLVFDPGPVVDLVRSYDRLCRDASIAPAAVAVSLAPVADEADLEFVRWLGADVSDEAERAILEGENGEASHRSLDRAVAVWREVREAVGSETLRVPVGANVEQLSPRHLADAGRLLEAIASALARIESTAR
jgi:5,10-methylenetetrahydrofolate reductase